MIKYTLSISLLLMVIKTHAGGVLTVGTDAACDMGPASLQSAVSMSDQVLLTNQVIYDSITITNRSAHITGGFNNCTDAESGVLSNNRSIISGNNTKTTIGIRTTAAGSNAPQNVVLENLTIIDGTPSTPFIGAGVSIVGNETVRIINSILENNTTTGSGAGIYVGGADAVLTLQTVTIQNNVAGVEGGGVAVSNAATAVIENSLIQLNEASFGAGISVASPGSKLTLIDSELTQNTASNTGGGLDCLNSVKVTIKGTSAIHANQAAAGGGLAINTDCQLVSFSGDTQPLNAIDYGIYNNSALNFGGGVLVNNGGRFDLIGNEDQYANLTGNEATSNLSRGGGIYVNGGESYARLINARVSKNEAVRGGAIAVRQGAKIQMRRSSGSCFGNQVCSLISENSALFTAAVHLESCGTADIYQTQISNNIASSTIVFSAEGNSTDICHSILEGNLIFDNRRLDNNPGLMMALDKKVSLDFAFNTMTENNASFLFSVRNDSGTVQSLNINGSIIWNAPAIPIIESAANNYTGNCFSLHDIGDLPVGFGNLIRTIDPVFTNAMNDDYSITEFSPFSDYCDTALYAPRFHDIVGTVRGHVFVSPVLGHYDMGAFEYDTVNINNVIYQDSFD